MWGSLALVAVYLLEFIAWRKLHPWLVEEQPQISCNLLKVIGILFPAFLLGVQRFYIYPQYRSPLRNLPGPKDHVFPIGQAINQFWGGDPNQPYLNWVRRWPDADMIRFMGPLNSDSLLAVSIEAHEQILKTHCYAFTKPGFYRRAVMPVTGRGLVFQDGDEHKLHRKIVAGSFSSSNIRGMVPTFHRQALELCSTIEQDMAGGTEAVVELVRRLSTTTLDVIGRVMLGVDFQANQRGTRFHDLYRRVFEPSPWGMVLIALNAVAPIRWVDIGENRRFNQNIASLQSRIRDIIKCRIRDLDAESVPGSSNGLKAERNDLLTYMIHEARASGEHWTDEELLGHTMTFMAAGHETTSNSLVWTIHRLAVNQSLQDRVRNELATYYENLSKYPHDDDAQSITTENGGLDNLPFLEKVFKEVMRLNAPAVAVAREAIHDVTICGVVIPKGTPITLMPSVINRSPRIWGCGRPGCVCEDEFDPDRWDKKKLEGSAAANPHAWATFFMGPRRCIGQEFVRREYKTLVAALITRFRFETLNPGEEDPGPVPLVNPSVVLRPKGGLRVRVFKL